MSNVKSYPHYEINVQDNSIYVPVKVDDLPIHRPMYPMKCQKGPIGVPVWCDTYSTAVSIFGAETFNYLNTTYFSRSAFFLYNTLQSNGAFIVRLADDTAVTASLVLELDVTTVAAMEQWEVDADGIRLEDENGDYVSQDPVVEEAGLSLAWKVRALTSEEEIDGITSVTVTDTTTYPMMVFTATSGGLWGNDTGFSLSYRAAENDVDQVDRVGAIFYSMAPISKAYGTSTTSPVRDVYTSTYNSFVMKSDVIDTATDTPVSIGDVISKCYDTGYELPYDVYVYEANFLTVGTACKAVETNRADEIADGWMINLMSAKHIDGLPYDHIIVTAGTGITTLAEGINHYLLGGTDGTLTDSAIETLIVSFLAGDINPDIVDKPRYPITHIFDTGFALATKYSIIDFLDTRDDIKVIMSTQNGALTPNTKLVDESTGSALRNRALLMVESVIKGTGACRAEIFQQCGKPVNTNYNAWIPATLWSAMKYAEFQNRDFLNKEPKGLPNADVSIFKEYNWVPNSEDLKARSWDTGLNYFQYYTMKNLHYAGVRTVYRYDTSVLMDTTFTDAIVYTKHEVRQSWAKFASMTLPTAIIQQRITDDMTERLSRLFNSKYAFTVSVYQTEEEARLGFVQHVLISITAPAGARVWVVDIECNREGYEG